MSFGIMLGVLVKESARVKSLWRFLPL